MNKKNLLIMSCVALVLVSLTAVTYAYFSTGVRGNVQANIGSINLLVNDANVILNEEFSATLKRSETENFVIPGDSGYFDLNLNATGSVGDVLVEISIDTTGLPENLKFYLNENHTNEFTTGKYFIPLSDNMIRTVPIYWYWEDIDDANDSLFIGKTITANVNVVASMGQAKSLYNTIVSKDYTLDTNVDFGQGASETNGQGLMMLNTTQNDEYPVLYYRGDVSNNNVIFADLCWLIVRTTETGGIKLVFNGPVVENADGTESCTNYSGVGGVTANSNYTDVYTGNTTTAFNTSYNSPVHVGYMYNDVDYTYSKTTLTTDYVAHLSDNTIDSTTGRHTQNLNDSTIKGVVDDWYEVNIKGKPEESLLEDTVWCNDRSVISDTYSIENYENGTNNYFYFAAYTRLYENATKTPSLVCSRDMDKFTVDSANGNGDLDYPIGLLTADEINLAGHPYNSSQTTYLSLATGSYQWPLSPRSFANGGAGAFFVYAGLLSYGYVYRSCGARPSVSLGLGAYVTSGNGTFETPYRVW